MTIKFALDLLLLVISFFIAFMIILNVTEMPLFGVILVFIGVVLITVALLRLS